MGQDLSIIENGRKLEIYFIHKPTIILIYTNLHCKETKIFCLQDLSENQLNGWLFAYIIKWWWLETSLNEKETLLNDKTSLYFNKYCIFQKHTEAYYLPSFKSQGILFILFQTRGRLRKIYLNISRFMFLRSASSKELFKLATNLFK